MRSLHAIVHRAHRLAFAHDLGRHALADFALRTAILDERFGRPGEHVDKARRDRHSFRVDRRLGVGGLEIADAHDPIAANGNVGDTRLVAGAVVESAAFDYDVEWCRRRSLLNLGEAR